MNAIVAFPTPAEKAIGEQYRALRARLQNDDVAARDRAYAAFSAAGLPHRRIEAWHYTDLRSILREVLPPAEPPDALILDRCRAALTALSAAPGGRIVMVDGRFVPELSMLPPAAEVGVSQMLDEVTSPALLAAQALGAPEAVVALNHAFVPGGVAITVAAGVRVAQPVEILSIIAGAAPAAIYTRTSVELGADAELAVSERHLCLAQTRSQAHHVTIVALADRASLDHAACVADLAPDTLHVASMLVKLEAASVFASTTLVTHPGTTRRQAYLNFAGEHAKAEFRGASLLDGRAHADTTLVVTHTAPHCESRELYKHVLDGQATGVYQGKVIVAPGAQKTDGKMLSKAVFLGDDATMHNKPELEIFADDVVCGHGATVGALDSNQLFYLRARGIPKPEAEAMLLEAFAEEALETIGTGSIRLDYAERIAAWLRQRGH